jgi:hypothetical protein
VTAFKPHPDFEVLQRLFPAVRELQQLADKHGIDDIFQDNGGKILQLCLCLGIDVLPGREGNDAVDVTTGGEFELKTLNVRKKGGFTTHHHMNPTIIEKYRRVTWIFAAYEGIELRAIWRLTPTQMEPWFEKWSHKWHASGGKDINNPKIARSYVLQNGELLYSIGGPLEFSKPKKSSRL